MSQSMPFGPDQSALVRQVEVMGLGNPKGRSPSGTIGVVTGVTRRARERSQRSLRAAPSLPAPKRGNRLRGACALAAVEVVVDDRRERVRCVWRTG